MSLTGLVLGNVSRRCRRRLFFIPLFGVVGFALTSRMDAPLLNVYEEKEIDFVFEE